MDQIEQVRQKTDIVELIGSHITLKKAGRNFKALCPFHSEKTPSFVVSPERQIFKCFGCGQGGSVFNFLMEYEGMDFGETLRFLADKAGIKLKSQRPSKDYEEKTRLLEVNHLAAEFYHYILLHHQMGEKGLRYLLGRGISKASIKTFKLGYAPEAWENLQAFLVRKKSYRQSELEKAGLIIQGRSSYYDRFRGRIIFPLFDHRNNNVGFSGRTLEKNPKGAKYINTPETILYHKSDLFYGLNVTKPQIKKKNLAVVVEGELDLISSFQGGVRNVVAIKGSAFTESQVSLIKRFTENIALALDEDAAGDAAARRGIEIADAAGLNIKVIQAVWGKDPDECAQHDPRLWRQSVSQSIPVYDFYFKSTIKRFGSKTVTAKQKISEELIPILAQISNEVIKAHYLKKLAHILRVGEEAVVKELERFLKKQKIAAPVRMKPEKKVEEKSRREKLEELALSLFLQQEKNRRRYFKQLNDLDFHTNAIKRIFAVLQKYMLKQDKFRINQIAEKLPEELKDTLDRLYLKDLQIDLNDQQIFAKELNQILKELKKICLKDKLQMLVAQIKEAEKGKKSTSQAKVEKLKKEFTAFSQELKELV